MPAEGMGHALAQIHGALNSSGVLADLRPVSAQCPIDLVTPDTELRVGEVDASGMEADDEAADHAAQTAVERGWYEPKGRTEIAFDYYWDEIEEMESYVRDSVRMVGVKPSMTELARIQLETTGPTRVRCRRALMLAVYEKRG